MKRKDVDRLTRRLWHTSQHNRCPIYIAGRIQSDLNKIRAKAKLPTLGWNDSVSDKEVGRCSTHAFECKGQHTHGR